MLLVAVAFASLGSVQTPPLWIKTLGYSASEVWTVEISKPGIPVVTTKIQGAPVDLMFDTANMAGLSISTNKAKELNLSVVGKWEDLDSSGAVIGYTSVFRVKEMSVFGQTWSDQRATSIDDDQVHGTLFGYGLLGPKYLQGCIVTFDYQSGLVAVRRGPGKSLPGWKELKMVVSDAFPGLPLVHGKVNGRPLLMELDTGKSRCVVDPELDHELNFPITVHGSKIQSVEIGPLEFTVPAAKVASFKGLSQRLPEPLLIGVGSDLLSKFVWSIDYARSVVMVQNKSAKGMPGS